uniref:Si:ch211-285j22.3 n=1 Tax=Cyprinus carpio carpio TaxID=630221 RepID=A0A9J8BYU9_CYPCA
MMTEIAKAQTDSVVSSVESMLADAAQIQIQCKERSAELAAASVELHEETQSLREHCEATQLDMARLRRMLDELLDTKHAYEARERQTRKLSKQL